MTRLLSLPRCEAILWLIAALAAGAMFLCTAAGMEAAGAVLSGWQWAAAQFHLVNTSTPLLTILFPTIVCAAFVAAVMLFSPSGNPWARVVVIALLVALYSVYMAYRLFTTLNLSTGWNALFSILFLGAEVMIYIKSLSANLQMLWLKDRTPEATRLAGLVASGDYLPEVDIFLPSYSEPVEILRRSILGCQSLRYPRKNIYLLDDQRRPQMRALAEELGCHYRDRPDNRHAKAGNMNAALPTTHGELIAVFDADFVPTADFLERTVGFFMDEKVGLVQTPQNFYSVDAVSRNLGLPNVITEEQQVFFRAAQPGRDTFGAPICHGTSFVIRRIALAEIGNFPGETLSEDWATSIKLQAAGYRCLYLNELLSAGAAAEFTSEFVTQRLRWARGTLQCFFASTNPLTVPGLTLTQRLLHLCGPIHYLPFVSRFFCLLLPLLYLFCGIVPIDTSAELLLFFFLPYCVTQVLALSWLTRGHRSAFWSEVYETMLCFPMTLTVFSTLLRPFGKPFKVSAKGDTKAELTFCRTLGVPLLLMLGLYAVAIAFALAHAADYPSKSVLVLVLGWSGYSVVLLWLSLQASFDVPQPSTALRFKHALPATLFEVGQPRELWLRELSDVDAVLAGPDLPATGAELALSIPAVGLERVPVALSAEAMGVVLRFEDLTIPQQRALVAALYCRPGQWDDRGVGEHVTFWHFLLAPFRMYPLAETQ